jgi:hypothetical protein
MLKLIRAFIVFILVVLGYIIALPITIFRIGLLVSNILMDDIFLQKKDNKETDINEKKD